jgi:hypothetical protein
MLDDILQGLRQHAVETEGDVRWQSFRDVLDVKVNLCTMPMGQLFARRSHHRLEPEKLQSRGVKTVRHRLNIAHEIRNLLAGRSDLQVEFSRGNRRPLLQAIETHF